MFPGGNAFGTDEYISYEDNETNLLFDYDDNKYSDDKYTNNNEYTENFEQDENKEIEKQKEYYNKNIVKNENKNAGNNNSPSSYYLMKELYNKLSSDITYLFIILVLFIICIIQKNNIDQMKLIMLLTLSKSDTLIKSAM